MPRRNGGASAANGKRPSNNDPTHSVPQVPPAVNGVLITSEAALDAKLDRLRDDILEAVATQGPPKLLNRAELSQWLGVSIPVIKKLEGDGLPTIRLSETYRYSVDAVSAWLASRVQP